MYYWRRGKEKKPEWKEKWELCFWEKNVCQKRSHEFYRHLQKLQSKGHRIKIFEWKSNYCCKFQLPEINDSRPEAF